MGKVITTEAIKSELDMLGLIADQLGDEYEEDDVPEDRKRLRRAQSATLKGCKKVFEALLNERVSQPIQE